MKRIFEVANENGLDSKTIIDIAWSELGINISSHLCGVNPEEEKALLICLGIIKEPKKEKKSNDVRDKKRINSEYDLIVKESNLYNQILKVSESIQDIKKLASDDPLRNLFRNYDISDE